MLINQEIWKPITNYEGLYEISNYGRIKSFLFWHGTNKRILNPWKDKNGYLCITLSKDGIHQKYKIHRLVLEIFIGPCPEGMEVCHNDNNLKNNFIKNLRYDTHKNNMNDQIKHGTRFNKARGSTHYLAKLNDWKIRIINRLLEDGYLTQKEIAKIFNVCPDTIHDIKNKETWKHVA
jgi:hypothetical protein